MRIKKPVVHIIVIVCNRRLHSDAQKANRAPSSASRRAAVIRNFYAARVDGGGGDSFGIFNARARADQSSFTQARALTCVCERCNYATITKHCRRRRRRRRRLRTRARALTSSRLLAPPRVAFKKPTYDGDARFCCFCVACNLRAPPRSRRRMDDAHAAAAAFIAVSTAAAPAAARRLCHLKFSRSLVDSSALSHFSEGGGFPVKRAHAAKQRTKAARIVITAATAAAAAMAAAATAISLARSPPPPLSPSTPPSPPQSPSLLVSERSHSRA